MVGTSSSVKMLNPYGAQEKDVFNDRIDINDQDLIIGDHFVVTEDMLMPCDAVLVSGRVVMNESMLTGESIPVTKSPFTQYSDRSLRPLTTATSATFSTNLPHDDFIELSEKRPGCVLFAGTKVKHVIGDAVCVTYRTGFRSAKGQLICSLLHPNQNFLNFFEDVIWVVIFMFLLASVLFGYQAYYLYVNGYTNTYIVVLYFDALTDAIPIGLIICLVVSTAIALARLRNKGMFVSESARVNMAGITSVVCFDKTGTLTDEHLKFHSAAYLSVNSENCEVSEIKFVALDSRKNLHRITAEVMACCHDLSMTHGDHENPQGDLLEAELFRVAGWRMEMHSREVCVFAPPTSNNYDKGSDGKHVILRTFEFSPETARSSALVKRPDGSIVYLIKGSPESIISISDRNTVPRDIEARLSALAKKGLRVLAYAYLRCEFGTSNVGDFLSWSNAEFEKQPGICFGGIVCLVSNLKPDTRRTVSTLVNANIHVNMITGDHVHTAVAVAVDCGIIPSTTNSTPRNSPDIDNAVDGISDVSGDSNSAAGIIRDVEAVIASSDSPVYHFIVDVSSDNKLLITDIANDEAVDVTLLDLLRYAGAARRHLVKQKYFSVVDQLIHESSRLLSAFSDEETHANVDVYNPLSTDKFSLWATRPVGQIYLAVTGKALNHVRATHPAFLLHSLVRYATVFARAKPNDKKFIVELIMSSPSYSTMMFDEITELEASNDAEKVNKQLDAAVTVYNEEDCVLFCGDGANDMAALRACTVGLSLCDVETSIAAPVTSRNSTPFAVIDLIIDGRWSICTAYTLASFQLYYGIITTFMYVVLFGYGIMESDAQFTVLGCYQVLVSVAILVLRDPSTPLSYELPPKRYFSRQIMVVLVPQFLLIPLFQLLAIYVLSQQSWYVKYETDDPLTSGYAYEATVLMLICMAQTMISAAVSVIGAPFMQDWWNNVWFWASNIPTLGWLLYSTFAGDSSFAENDLDMEPIPTYFGFIMCGLYAANIAAAALCYLLSTYVLYQPRIRRALPVVLEEK
jgi:magnesium-transporting ATPase (P-type)